MYGICFLKTQILKKLRNFDHLKNSEEKKFKSEKFAEKLFFTLISFENLKFLSLTDFKHFVIIHSLY